MSVPSMVHRSGDNLVVRSVVSGDPLYEASTSADVPGVVDDEDVAVVVVAAPRPLGETAGTEYNHDKDLPDCKVRRNYTCASCDFFTQNPRLFLYHLRDVHKEKVRIYECPNCLYASKHFQKLLRHSKMVHGDGVELSSSSTSSTSSSSRHSLKRPAPEEDKDQHGLSDEEAPMAEDPDRPTSFKCSVCDFTSWNQTQLNKHEREDHIKTKFFRCSKCTYVTHIKARYTKHVKYHSMPMIKCDMCDFRTPYKWNLDRHCKNHNGKGVFRCSACNFTADIKQSLTVHEMNHHMPPVGQAAGLGVGRRRNKVGASDATAAEEATGDLLTDGAATDRHLDQVVLAKEETVTKINQRKHQGGGNPINHQSNGKVSTKGRLCNFRTGLDSDMAKHEKSSHKPKKTHRPIPNLIPIPSSSAFKNLQESNGAPFRIANILETTDSTMSQTVINDICSKSANSSLKDLASLFGSEDVFKSQNQDVQATSKVPDLIPTSVFPQSSRLKNVDFKQKNASFFDKLKEKLELGTGCNLICNLCGHESKCLTEQVKHQKSCGKEISRVQNTIRVHNISGSRCQFCRQRCKSSADLYNHVQTCAEALKHHHDDIKQEEETLSEQDLKIDEDRQSYEEELDVKPHPMENKVFVWNDIMVPMDIEVDDSNYEYTDDKVDETSLDLSIRTQSPYVNENNYLLQEKNNNTKNAVTIHPSPIPLAEKIATHGNDITTAQHKRVFKCPHCTFWASTASRFHVHIVGHLNKKPFECSLCSYRSNWRWDITKHIKLKSVRDQAHETAKVLMTDETGRRNYTKYNKYLTEIPLSSLHSSSETSGGSGTRPRHLEKISSPSNCRSEKHAKSFNANESGSLLRGSSLKQTSVLKQNDGQYSANQDKKKSSDSKRILFKCKRCNYRDASKENLHQHVKEHFKEQYKQQRQQRNSQDKYIQQEDQSFPNEDILTPGTSSTSLLTVPSFSSQDLSLRGTSPDRDERHCRLKHSGDIRVVSNRNGQEKVEIEEQDELENGDVVQGKPYRCSSCPYCSNDQGEFEMHLQGHLPQSENSLSCNLCKYYVSTRDELLDHLKLHSDFESNELPIPVSSSNDVDNKKFKCTVCPYVTNSKSQYSYHKQFHKARGGQHTCTYCSYNVSKRHLLHQHMKIHGINFAPPKQNGDAMEPDEPTSEMEPDSMQFDDIPLVWVSKNDKFCKMYKCRFCPHVNLRKVNIHDHEKMHRAREKNPNLSRPNDVDHRCTECNYVCNNAGVLSSHVKVHQGLYNTIHCLVDPTQSDEEQLRELYKAISHVNDDLQDSANIETEDFSADSGSTILYFCNECPGRFLREDEYNIHRKLHSSLYQFRCELCSYSAEDNSYLLSHLNVHSDDYYERSKVLSKIYNISSDHPQPVLRQKNGSNGNHVWVVAETINDNANVLSKKHFKSLHNVPLSGTDLFRQREAQQRQIAEEEHHQEREQNSLLDKEFKTLMQGNPEFIYPTYIKNGRTKEKRYKCHKCPTAFEKREQYKVHLGLHGSKQRYSCESCDYSVKYYANYTQHLKKHKFSDDAQVARKSDVIEENGEINENMDIAEDSSLNLSTADQQIMNITQERNSVAPVEDKKHFWCSNCPYVSNRKDAVENHQKRHVSVSGIKNSYTCEHCDYSVPQAHFLRDHTKLHFLTNKAKQVDAYMICDNLKLTSETLEASTTKNESLVFVGPDSEKDEAFLPPLNDKVAERFNNNRGEKQLVNVQAKSIVIKKDTSDNICRSNCQMEVN